MAEEGGSPAASLDDLDAIMRRLRDPDGGCPWDLEQTFASIAPYTIEEAYEVADAIERGDFDGLKDELGDLQLQVVYHARIAAERGLFTLADVIAAICDKMIRRHPHVFGDGESPGWEAIKASERGTRTDPSALAGVALALPALKRAEKIQRRAARVGFDWVNIADVRAKLLEEIDEIDAAVSAQERADEIGDLLFAAVNLARHHHVEPEQALRAATAKFERRFRAMEVMAGDSFAGLSLHVKERLWRAAKQAEADETELRTPSRVPPA